MAQINHDLALRIELYVRAVHGARRRPFEIDALRIVPASVTRTLELVFSGFPVGRAAKVRAHRGNHEDPLGISDYPNPVLVLKFGVYAEPEIRRVSDAKPGLRFV